MQKVDLTGMKFSMLTVLKEVEPLNGKKRYECFCDCGNKVEISYANLKSGNKRMSCGCMKKKWLKDARTTHGGKYTKLYRTWQSMKSRSVNSKTFYDSPNRVTYKNKKIKCCEAWLKSFENFKEWALANGYMESLSIDRIDNNGNYEPSNCQWITIGENSRKDWIGKSNSKCRKLTDKDVVKIKELLETGNHTQKEIAGMFCVERTTISRIKRGVLNYV